MNQIKSAVEAAWEIVLAATTESQYVAAAALWARELEAEVAREAALAAEIATPGATATR